MNEKEESDKPSTLSAIIGWGIGIAGSSPFMYLFGSGYLMNHSTFNSSGVAVVDNAALIGPGIGGGILLAFMVSDITFKFIGRTYRRYRGFNTYTPSPSDHDVLAAQWAEDAWESAKSASHREESRREVKARERTEKENRAKSWEELHARHDALILAWSKYETDVALMIDYPIMTDYTDPVIHKVIAAMQKIRTAKMMHEDETKIEAHDSSLNDAVNEFELSFQAAERYARRYGQTKLDPREQRKLSAARSALNIILDGESPAFEVEAAYKSLRSSLKGIIDVPEKAVAELEARVRREIMTA